MELTQKIRIYPTTEQEEVLWILSEASVTYNMQQDELPEIKKKCPEYEWVYSKV